MEGKTSYYLLHKDVVLKQQKEYYHIHSGEKYNKVQWIYYQKAEWYYSCIAELKCFYCGISFGDEPRLADFHHVTKSSNDVAALAALRHSYNKFCSEPNKGVYLCPNCHRLEHVKEGKRRCQTRKRKLSYP